MPETATDPVTVPDTNTAPSISPPNPPTASPPVPGKIVMTEAEFNAKLAEHKRGLQQQLRDSQSQLQQMDVLRRQVSELMPLLPEGTDFDDIASSVSSTLDAMKTEREKLEAAQRTQAERLSAAEKDRDAHLQTLHDTLIRHELGIELGPKAVSAQATKVLANELAKYAIVGKDNTITYKLPITDENGHTAVQEVGVAVAVKQLESDVENWGFAFKATRNSGAGGEPNGVMRTPSGELDLGALMKDPAKFFEMQRKNPDLVAQAAQKALGSQL